MLLTSSDTKRTLRHLFLFTNSAQRELVSICTQSIHNRNWLSLPYILDASKLFFRRMSFTDLSKHHSKHRNIPFHPVCEPSFFLSIYCKFARSEGEGQIYAKLLVPLCDLVTPLFIILRKSMRTVSEFNEFEPRLKSAKNRFQLSAGLNLEILNTILSETNHIWAAA